MPQPIAPGRVRTLESLVELVAALDRRVPHVERSTEQKIAVEAGELRAEASSRIGLLRAAASRRRVRELALSNAVLSDDGGPALD